MLITNVSLLAVFLATISNMILGYLWYGPFFGKKWMAIMGVTKEGVASGKQDATKAMLWAVVVALITSYVLADLIYYSGYLTLSEAIQFALLIWLGFIATTHANNSIFESRKWGLYIIGVSYQLVSLLLMATLIVLIQ